MEKVQPRAPKKDWEDSVSGVELISSFPHVVVVARRHWGRDGGV